MNEIIDVEYREITDLNEKPIEELCKEVNLYWDQMEILGKMGVAFAAEAGQRLINIKSRLKHGEWGDWCAENLNFSKTKAESMMKLARKISDEGGLFFKNTNFVNIGISKVWALLDAPEEAAAEVVETSEIESMTVKELKEELKRTKEEMATESREARQLREERKTLQEELEILKQQESSDPETVANLEAELQKTKDKLSKKKEQMRQMKAAADSEKEQAARQAAEKAKQETEDILREKFKEETRILAESNREAAEEIERLKRNQNEDIVVFKVQSDALQKCFANCIGAADRVKLKNEAQGQNMMNALRKLMENLIEAVE